MNPLRQDDPRHEKALKAIDPTGSQYGLSPLGLRMILAAYYASLSEQGVVLVEAYAGDDAGRT